MPETTDESPASPAAGPLAGGGPGRRALTAAAGFLRRHRFPLGLWVGMLAALWLYGYYCVAYLPMSAELEVVLADYARRGIRPPESVWFEVWAPWDATFYQWIAANGYEGWHGGVLSETDFSPHPFFPGYPVLIAALVRLLPGLTEIQAGFLVSAACGLGAFLLLYRLVQRRWGEGAARTTLLLLALHPASYFLFGTVYAEALFLLASLGALAAQERDRPLAAGLLGALATGSRVLGAATVAGLAAGLLDRRRDGGEPAISRGGLRARLSAIRARDGWLLLSLGGIGGYMFYQWWTFDDPLLFMRAHRGWNVRPGIAPLRETVAWLLEAVLDPPRTNYPRLIAAGYLALFLSALVRLPAIARRQGLAHAAYAAGMLLIPLASVPKLEGCGRYHLVAYPCTVAAGADLTETPRSVRVRVYAVSAIGLALLFNLFVRYLST